MSETKHDPASPASPASAACPPTCAFCYVACGGAAKKCGKCGVRRYCSRDCQVKDWKNGHKRWCGAAGEKDVDWAVRSAGARGQGLFAARAFAAGDKILVERAVILATKAGAATFADQTAAGAPLTGVLAAIDALAPEGGFMEDKMSTNAVSVRDDADDAATAADEVVSSGLFVNFSRVNHSCVGNATHWYHPAQKLMLLVANHAIAAGDEVTFSYAANVSAKNYDGGRRAVLKKGWGIDPCDCRACRPPAAPEHGGDADLDAKVDMRVDLDGRLNDFQMGVLGDMEREGGTWGAKVASADKVVAVKEMVSAGLDLVKLLDDLKASPMTYSR